MSSCAIRKTEPRRHTFSPGRGNTMDDLERSRSDKSFCVLSFGLICTDRNGRFWFWRVIGTLVGREWVDLEGNLRDAQVGYCEASRYFH